jgi:hypothetical protein
MVNLEKELGLIWAYDFEVFPNFTCVTLVNVQDRNLVKNFEFSEWQDDRLEFLEFIRQDGLILLGYNSESYDNLITNFFTDNTVRMGIKLFLKLLYKLSSDIVNDIRSEVVKECKFAKRTYRYIDMFKIKPSSNNKIGLKQLGINLKWNKIQDTPHHFNKRLTYEEAREVLAYNINDVRITLRAFDKLSSKIEMRAWVSESYGVDVINQTESGIANVILTEKYAKKSGLRKEDFYNERTDRSYVEFTECIAGNISFDTQPLRDFLEAISQVTVYKNQNFKFEIPLRIGNVTYQMGVGGLHSEDSPAKFETTDRYIIRDADATSFYPNNVLNNGIIPAHLDHVFFDIYREILSDRQLAKSEAKLAKIAGDKKRFQDENNKQESLKITANSIFGKFNSEFFWLYDPKCLIQTTVNGQLYLLMLIERLEMAGINVISANTDGVVAKIRRDQEGLYSEICKGWEADTNFSLEYTDYKLYIRRDVNNYISIKDSDGENLEVKLKGAFDNDINLFKGYKSPIVPKAVLEFLVNGVPITDTIRNCDSIYEFCRSQKVGSDFESVLLDIVNRKVISIKLQKNNRFFASTKGGTFQKVKKSDGSVTRLLAGKRVQVVNDINETVPIESYDIDYDFYIDEAWKLIDGIIPRKQQLSIFDMTG